MRHIVVAAPLRGRETGAPLGIIANYYHLHELDKILSGEFQIERGAVSGALGRRETLDIYLVNKEKLLITPSRFGGEVPKQRVETLPVLECAEGREIASVYKNHLGSEVIGASMCIPVHGWTLIAEIGTAEAFAPVAALMERVIGLGIAVAGLTFFLAYLLAIGISNPVVVLSRAAQKLALGDFSVRAPVGSQDEIGELVVSFNKMAQQLGESQSALRHSEEKYRSLVETAFDGIGTLDGDGNFVFVNVKYCDMLGYSKDELLARNFADTLPESEGEEGMRLFKEIIKEELPFAIYEGKNMKKDGSAIDVQIKWRFVCSNGAVSAFGIVRDVTERRRAEEALRIYAAKLEEANHLKDLFTDVMRHDLLNPAGTIKNFAELLVEEAKDEEQKESALAIKRNANRLIDLIESASTYAKLESVEKLERKKLDLNEVFRNVINDFKTTLEERRMKLEYLAKGKCHAMVNPMIENVFSNLLSNAIKYSPEGRKIEVNITDENEHYKIYVKDWGYGIAADDKQHIFQRFKRVDKKGVKGTGLGLAIVKRVVELHNGKVWVEDNTGGEACFMWSCPSLKPPLLRPSPSCFPPQTPEIPEGQFFP